jgi:DNA mismatch repair protein MutS2
MTQMIRMIRLVQKTSDSFAGEPEGSAAALVLLDELATSTDPAEGAALAEALLKRLAALRLKVVVTTHYSALKALAQSTPAFMNASVEFDVPTLSPTYRLMLGLPGGSSALEIAGRLGMDRSILEDAKTLLRADDRLLEQVLAELQDKQRTLDRDTERARAMRQEAEEAAQEATAITERLRASEREAQRRIRKNATDDLMRTRAELQSVLDGLKRERTLAKISQAKQRVAEIAGQLGRAIGPAKTMPVEQLEAGAQVEIGRFGTVATLLESPQGKRRVRVRVGETEMSVEVDGLIGLAAGHARSEKPVSSGNVEGRVTSPESNSDDAGVVDVRGAGGDEALERVIAALDRAALAGTPSLRIIHGHGTGRLRSVLRSYLRSSGYVARFRPGERAEGGDGVTIAELK